MIKLNRISLILLLGANLWYFGEGMLGPLFAVFSEKVGGDILDITWAWAAYLVVTGVCYIVVGKLINGKPYQVFIVQKNVKLYQIFAIQWQTLPRMHIIQ